MRRPVFEPQPREGQRITPRILRPGMPLLRGSFTDGDEARPLRKTEAKVRSRCWSWILVLLGPAWRLLPQGACGQPPTTLAPMFKDPAGTFTLHVRRVARVRTFEVPGGLKAGMSTEVQCLVEFGRPVMAFVQLPLEEARDDTGKDLLPAREGRRARPFHWPIPVMRAPTGFPQTASCQYQLNMPAPGARTIAVLKGRLSVLSCLGWEKIAFEAPLHSQGQVCEGKHARVTLKEMKEAGDSFSCKLAIAMSEPPPLPKEVEESLREGRTGAASSHWGTALQAFRVTLVDAQGNRHESQSCSGSWTGVQGDLTFTWPRELGGPPPAPPKTLEVQAPAKYEALQAPFELRDIPLL